MARGWESKAIESQMLDAEHHGERGEVKAPNPQERAKLLRLNNLALSRTRVEHELQRCASERFRVQLKSELAFLEAEIAKLKT